MIIYIQPVPKPRQTRSDIWKKRPCVLRYRAYADELRLRVNPKPQCPFKVTFHIHTDIKKRNGEPHLMLGDADNYAKGFIDSLWAQDKHIWSFWAEKRWTSGLSFIEITQL